MNLGKKSHRFSEIEGAELLQSTAPKSNSNSLGKSVWMPKDGHYEVAKSPWSSFALRVACL